MKITVKDYPVTFSFELEKPLETLPERTAELIKTMKRLKITSTAPHEYDDYVVEGVVHLNGDEEWLIGS